MATFNGNDDDNYLYADSTDDSLYGFAGNDQLYGNDGNDSLTGGAGNDTMQGNNGDDIYLLSSADGLDEIANYDTDASIDSVNFTDFATNDLTAVYQAADTNHLIFQYGNGSQLTVDYFFSNDANYRVDQFQFTDSTWTVTDIAQNHNGTSYSETLVAFDNMANTLNGLAGNDWLYGGNDADVLNGGTGGDVIYGNEGSDTLNGGLGNDTMQGDNGADTYQLGLADGVDRIFNYDTDASVDTINFTDFAPDDLTAVFHAYNTGDLVFQYGNGSQLTVAYYFNDDVNYRVDQFLFADTTVWTLQDIAQHQNGTAYGEALNAFNDMANTINGMGGSDWLNGGNDADSLNGGTGNDMLFGNDGNDTLNGGIRKDTLEGGNGADTYVLSIANGMDELNNYDTDGSYDIVAFSDVLSPFNGATRIFQAFNTDNLVIKYEHGGGQLTVNHYFNNDANYRVDELQFADTWWTLTDIAQNHNGTANSETLVAFDDMNNTINGLAGDDELIGGNYADILNGGKDNDRLYGNDGDDTLNGGAGKDILEGGNGFDTYVLGLTDGVDEIKNYDTDGSFDIVQFSDVFSPFNGTTRIFHEFNTDNLVIAYGNGGQLTVDYYFSSDTNYRVDGFLFADTSWSLQEIAQNHNGTANSETLVAFDDMNNTINGLGGDDTLRGGNSTDTLNGGKGNDRLYGNDGDDTLNGGAGKDFLEGGNGFDTYVLNMADGVDEVYNYDTDGSFDIVQFSDVFSPFNGTTHIFHEFNTDNLVIAYGNGGQLTVDYYFSSDTNYRVDGIWFADTQWSLTDIAQNHNGTANSETLVAFDDMTNTINGLGGDDTLRGGNNTDTLNGGKGNDYLIGGDGSDTYVFGLTDGGVDEINNYDTDGSFDIVNFIDFASTDLTAVYQDAHSDNLVFKYGKDSQLTVNYYFGDVNYRVDQFQFTDTSWSLQEIAQHHNGTAYSENLYGFDFMPNTINGMGGGDRLYGHDVEDNLNGGTGNDKLYGNDGNDTLIGGAGKDYLEGGNGSDTYEIGLADGLDRIHNHDTDGSMDNVNFVGFTSGDVSSVFHAFKTDDLVFKFDNGNRLTVDNYFSGVDYRVDEFYFTNDNTTWRLADIAQRHNGTAYSETLTGFENEINKINGFGGDDALFGGFNSDRLIGGKGNDRLIGSDGKDILIGGADNDYLVGGNGADVLNGGLGNDTLIGGSGRDKFLFNVPLNSTTNVDSIEGYDLSGDLLVLKNTIFTQFVPGAIAAGHLVSGTDAVAIDANDFLIYDTATGALSYDADGNGAGAAVQFVTLMGIPALNAGDFLII